MKNRFLQVQTERQPEGQKYLWNLEEQNPRKFQRESDNIGDDKALAKNPTECTVEFDRTITVSTVYHIYSRTKTNDI